MADPNTRTGKRTPVTLKIKFKSETLEQFIERYAVDVSQGGIFIRTKEPLAVGTQMKFEFQLRDASPLIAGEGTVVWTRENDPSRPAIAPGMGVRFDRLAEGSPSVLERILAEKAKQQPQRSAADTTKPPMFTDTPTRVAPAPVQDLLSNSGNKPIARTRGDSEQTPLPKPTPFHSDADEFPEETFEEATKIRSLDELVAQTAQLDAGKRVRDLQGPGNAMATTIIPPDELAMRRHQARNDATIDDAGTSSPLIEPPPPAAEPRHIIDRDSAPGLPSPPEAARPAPRLLDTTPSPRAESGVSSDMPASKTRIGLEPAKADTRPGHAPPAPAPAPPAPAPPAMPAQSPAGKVATAVAAPKAAPPAVASSSMGSMRPLSSSEPMRPVKRPSIAPIIVIVIAFVAAAAAAVWFFILKDAVGDEDEIAKPQAKPTPAVTPTPPTSGSAVAVVTPGSDSGSAVAATGSGSATPDKGSGAGSATPAAVVDHKPGIDTVIGSTAEKATVTIEGMDITGPAPLTAKLEPGKSYKARVEAAGYATLEIDIKGGETGISAKLVAKPKLLTVTSDPPGAQILVDGVATGHVTPFDVDLKAYAGKGKLKITLRKASFRQVDEVVDVSAPTDEGGKLTVKAPNATLAAAPIAVPQPRPPTPHPHPPTGNGSGSDTGATPPTPGSGSAPEGNNTPTPTPTPTPPPAGSNAEPEPDFAK